jgi:hypothetical protein
MSTGFEDIQLRFSKDTTNKINKVQKDIKQCSDDDNMKHR